MSTGHEDPFQCNEYLGSDVDLKPKSCDAVFGAQYCIKHTGRYEGLEKSFHLSLGGSALGSCNSMLLMLLTCQLHHHR